MERQMRQNGIRIARKCVQRVDNRNASHGTMNVFTFVFTFTGTFTRTYLRSQERFDERIYLRSRECLHERL